MKRDLGLVRDLLLVIEEKQQHQPIQLSPNDGIDYDNKDIQYNLSLMLDAQLITGQNLTTFTDLEILINSITWQGHDFLDYARNKEVWEIANDKAESKGSELRKLPFDVARALLVESAKKLFEF
ncbi:DUF2513 domain-containing protein [Guptibacillus hwajinpoensis]|uniref:DUF2513 domain-containing protein n=1 Tax=Guptibacillus hwajinpoensis TaxID=208199 RepID=UPI003CFFEEC3